MTTLAIVGDIHGHLQLALAVLARWQQGLAAPFEAVFLCGDVGSFTHDSQLDSTTRRHGKANPCELEFLTQWAAAPPAPWLAWIFAPVAEGGLGISCPVIMVHGNHEGFDRLQEILPASHPDKPVNVDQLPVVDALGKVRYLPSGWRVQLPSGLVAAGIGGIERGQRYAEYHDLAYIKDEDVAFLLDQPPVDLLLTHQGPSSLQGDHGSATLDLLLESRRAQFWFHGHSTPHPEVASLGTTTVVPLGDVAFGKDGEAGADGWATLEDGRVARKEGPAFLREFRRARWLTLADGRLLCPPLARLAWGRGWW